MTDVTFLQDNERRLDRMQTWIDLAEEPKWVEGRSGYDPHAHVRFVFYWIAYEAAFQTYEAAFRTPPTTDIDRTAFHKKLAEHGRARLIEVLRDHQRRIHQLYELRQASPFFWKDRWENAEDWETRFGEKVEKLKRNLEKAVYNDAGHVPEAMGDIFRILNLVRQQIIHGGSAGANSQGRSQVLMGTQLLGAFVPRFFDIIEANKNKDWGKPPFPRVGWKPDDPSATPPGPE